MREQKWEWEVEEEPLFDRSLCESEEESELLALLSADLEAALRPVPPPNQSRMMGNRSAFLSAALELSPPVPASPSFWQGIMQQVLVHAALLCFLLMTTVIGARAASVNSLPGDRMYHIKLVVEQAEFLVRQDDKWADQLEARRRAEVAALVEAGRLAEVGFEGIPAQVADNRWQIDQVEVELDSVQQRILQHTCVGAPVKVQGTVRDGEFQLSHLTPSCLALDASTEITPVFVPDNGKP